tara:strand:- start:158 stop:319 length:162 start_codon:yes stop_codon:yes gene_type:complete
MGMGTSRSLRRRTCDEASVTAEVRAIFHAPEMRFHPDYFALPASVSSGPVLPR